MQIVNPRDIGREALCARRRYMLRQEDVARAVGVSRRWIGDFEKGKATLELGLVLRACDTLGLDLASTRRATPPDWTVPLTAHAEMRESRSLARARRRRMEARARATAIREGSLEPEPNELPPDDEALFEEIRRLNRLREERAIQALGARGASSRAKASRRPRAGPPRG